MKFSRSSQDRSFHLQGFWFSLESSPGECQRGSAHRAANVAPTALLTPQSNSTARDVALQSASGKTKVNFFAHSNLFLSQGRNAAEPGADAFSAERQVLELAEEKTGGSLVDIEFCSSSFAGQEEYPIQQHCKKRGRRGRRAEEQTRLRRAALMWRAIPLWSRCPPPLTRTPPQRL